MKRIFFLLLSFTFLCCSEQEEEVFNNDIIVDTEYKTVNFGEEFTIKAISDLPLTYTTENEYHATIDSIDSWDNANIKARYVGKTVIKISNGENTKEVDLIVSAQSNLFPTPPVELFGNSKQEVIASLGTPNEENDTSITYHAYSETAPYISYYFKENILYSIRVTYEVGRSFALNNYLVERYRFAGIFNDKAVGNGYVFYNSLKGITPTIGVYVYALSQNYDAIVYQPYIETKEETNTKIAPLLNF